MLPSRKSVPRSSRQLDHNKTLYDRKETRIAVVRSCFPFIRSGQTILQGTMKGGRRQGGQRKRWEDNIRMDRPGVRQVPEDSGKQGKMEKTGCRINCGAPTTLAVKGLMMIMMMMMIMMTPMHPPTHLPLPHYPHTSTQQSQTHMHT